MSVSLDIPVDKIGSLTTTDIRRTVGLSKVAVVVKYKVPRFGIPPFETRFKTFNALSELGVVRDDEIINFRNLENRESRFTVKYGVENGLGNAISEDSVISFLRDNDSIIDKNNPDINLDLTLSMSVSAPSSAGVRTVTVSAAGKIQAFPDFESFLNGASFFRAATKEKRVSPDGLNALEGPATVPISRAKTFTCDGPPPTAVLCSERPTLRIRRGPKRVVTNLQNLLNVKANAGLVVDGIFGRGTDSAVRAWQSKNRLGVDGILGPRTWNSLCQ